MISNFKETRMLIYTWLKRKSFSNRSSLSTRKFWHGTNSWNLVQHIPMKTMKSQTYQKESLVVFCFFCFFSAFFFPLSFTLTVGSSNLLLALKLDFGTSEAFLIEMLMWPFEMQDSPGKGWRQRLMMSWMNQDTGCCLKSLLNFCTKPSLFVYSRALEVSA